MALAEADIQGDLDRRRPGTSRHVTQRNEPDAVEILSGVYEGLTTGTPICLLIRNTDQRSKDYGNILDTFRPGHADYTYWRKYGVRDPRGGGRSSARLTAPTVAAGAVAKKWLAQQYGAQFRACMTQLGELPIPFESWDHVRANPFFAPVADVQQYEDYMDALRKAPADWFWLLRLHPLRRHTAPEIAALLARAGVTQVEMDAATTFPLFSLLRLAHHHVTAFSSVAVEAAAFDLRTSLPAPEGETIFAPEIARGICRYTPTGDALLAHIGEVLSGERAALGSDFIDMHEGIVDRALTAVLSP